MAVNYSVEYPLALRKITELEAENQRLRDALEKIANTDTSYAATAGTAYTMREIAKQTLEDK